MDVLSKNNNITRKYSLILLESKDKWGGEEMTSKDYRNNRKLNCILYI